ncbi:MAG: WbqC family protein [candidate division WOR-3 bacterium]
MRIGGVLQPGYLPWLGFFDQVARAEVFVLLDDVQYTVNDWRNRNRIKTKDGVKWLSIPVMKKGHLNMLIYEMRIDNSQPWQRKHWGTIERNYKKAKFFQDYADELRGFYERRWEYLVDLDHELIYWFADKLGIKTKFLVSSRDLMIKTTDKNERLFILCEKIGVDALYVGAAGANYMDPEVYAKRGITVIFQDYKHPVYTQLFGDFVPYLSTLDLLLNEGPRSLEIILRGSEDIFGKPS